MNQLLTVDSVMAVLFWVFYIVSAQSPCSAWANDPHLCGSDYFGGNV